MTTAEMFDGLLALGMTVKDAIQKSQGSSRFDWKTFLEGPAYKEVAVPVTRLLGRLTDRDLDDALRTVEAKQEAVRGGRPLHDLPADKLIQYSELSDARVVLAARKVKIAAESGFFSWLVEELMPVLLAAGPRLSMLLV